MLKANGNVVDDDIDVTDVMMEVTYPETKHKGLINMQMTWLLCNYDRVIRYHGIIQAMNN